MSARDEARPRGWTAYEPLIVLGAGTLLGLGWGSHGMKAWMLALCFLVGMIGFGRLSPSKMAWLFLGGGLMIGTVWGVGWIGTLPFVFFWFALLVAFLSVRDWKFNQRKPGAGNEREA